MAIHIERFECNMFQENCYVVSDETKECIIVDCGALYPEERKAICGYITANGLTVKRLICTHAHIDHNFGDSMVCSEYGTKPEVPAKDKILYEHLDIQAQTLAGIKISEPFPQDVSYYDENHTICFGNHTFKVLPTPGHTPGSCVIYSNEDRVAFSGDTLFKMSIGRTDLQLGSYTDMMDSLKLIASTLPADMTVLPGHGPSTNIGFEVKYNPYFK